MPHPKLFAIFLNETQIFAMQHWARGALDEIAAKKMNANPEQVAFLERLNTETKRVLETQIVGTAEKEPGT